MTLFILSFFSIFAFFVLLKIYKTLTFELSAVQFIQKSVITMIAQKDKKELDNIPNDLDILQKIVNRLTASLLIVTTIIIINTISISFIFLPGIQELLTWDTMIILLSIVNPLSFYILLKINKWKYIINSICNYYDIIIQSYDYIKEADEKQ